MDNDKTDGEGQVFTVQTSGMESTAADRTPVATPAATATATTETEKMVDPATESATGATTPISYV